MDKYQDNLKKKKKNLYLFDILTLMFSPFGTSSKTSVAP